VRSVTDAEAPADQTPPSVPAPRAPSNSSWVWRQAWPVLLAVGAVLVVWTIVSVTGLVSTSSLPSPATVWTTFWDLVRDGTIPTAAGRTLLRLILSFGVALILGTVLGMALAASPFTRKSVGALVIALQAIPPIAWLPLAAVWFGLNERAVVFVAVIGAFPAVTLATSNSVRHVPPLLYRAGQTLGARGWRLQRSVVFPAALPGYLAGMQLAWGYCWRALLAGELITTGAKTFGLGQELVRSQRDHATAEVIAILVIIVAIGMVVDLVIFGLVDRHLRLRRGLSLH
jgi:NitT/TauT family transport system permease protein